MVAVEEVLRVRELLRARDLQRGRQRRSKGLRGERERVEVCAEVLVALELVREARRPAPQPLPHAHPRPMKMMEILRERFGREGRGRVIFGVANGTVESEVPAFHPEHPSRTVHCVQRACRIDEQIAKQRGTASEAGEST